MTSNQRQKVNDLVRTMLRYRVNFESRLHVLLHGIKELYSSNEFVQGLELDDFQGIVEADDTVDVFEDDVGFMVARLRLEDEIGELAEQGTEPAGS